MYISSSPRLSDFEEAHINQVWDLLHEKFHFNVPGWKKDFGKFLEGQPRTMLTTDAFLMFGDKMINPLLNEILKRRSGHPTWQNMIRFIVSPPAVNPSGGIDKGPRRAR